MAYDHDGHDTKKSSGVAKAGLALGIVGTSLAGLEWLGGLGRGFGGFGRGGFGGGAGGGAFAGDLVLGAEMGILSKFRDVERLAAAGDCNATLAAENSDLRSQICLREEFDRKLEKLCERFDRKDECNEKATAALSTEIAVALTKIRDNRELDAATDKAAWELANCRFMRKPEVKDFKARIDIDDDDDRPVRRARDVDNGGKRIDRIEAVVLNMAKQVDLLRDVLITSSNTPTAAGTVVPEDEDDE